MFKYEGKKTPLKLGLLGKEVPLWEQDKNPMAQGAIRHTQNDKIL